MTTIDIAQLNEVRDQLLQHPVYAEMDSPHKIQIFMEHHVFAVWDFMSLLKRLQMDLTSISLPWMPNKQAQYARFINEIVLGEETDEDGQGGYASHFQLYIDAMDEVGADTTRIKRFIQEIESGTDPYEALKKVEVPSTVYEFVKQSLETAFHGRTHEVCASFFFGREDLIPNMFQVMLDHLEKKHASTGRLNYYLKRHIELDGDEHGPLAEKLLHSLCGDDQQKRREAEQTAIRSLDARIQLWNGVL